MSSITESDDSRITTAVGIDKDKNSQSAVKWAIEKLRLKNNRLILVHVKVQQTADPCTYSYSDLCVSSRISIQWEYGMIKKKLYSKMILAIIGDDINGVLICS